MTHQDFEKYALEKPMEGGVSENFKKIFFKYLNYKKKNLKVLDSGCGDGKYFDFLRSYFEQENIFGVEVSEKRIERCHKKGFFNAKYINKNERLPFNDSSFDLIISDQIIEHIPKKIC